MHGGGLIKGERFAADAGVMEANASRYHGKAPDELDWTDAQRQKRAVADYLAGLEAEIEAHTEGGEDSGGGGSYGESPVVPENPIHMDSRDEAESAHHAARCLYSFSCLGRLSPACSSRGAGSKSRISFSGISSILL